VQPCTAHGARAEVYPSNQTIRSPEEKAMAFSMRTKINGETLSLCGDAKGGVSISSHFADNELTVAFSSRNDLTVTGTGNLDAKIIGGAENDKFDFSGATGNYNFCTGGGNDKIIDGIGNNTFDGGAGNDTFVFNKIEGPASPDEVDTINNYTTDDKIDVGGQHYVLADLSAGHVSITFDDGDVILVNGNGINSGNLVFA
jgi:Ca2+-binding RTX toxin-like protein